ncbi:MAG: hypothetical protein ACYSTT_03440 [Planctomycetota bacterium]|jgi:hypothetical protein
MNRSNKTFRDKLLEMEKPNPTLKEKYEREVQTMVEKKLTGMKKCQIIGFLVISIILTIFFGTFTIIAQEGFPLWGRLMFAIGAVSSLAFIAMYTRILKKGSINLKKDNMSLAWTGWGLVVIVGTLVLVFSPGLPNRIVGVQMLVSVLFYLVGAGVLLLRAHVQRSEVNTREKLLEIELHLTEISEKIEKSQDN